MERMLRPKKLAGSLAKLLRLGDRFLFGTTRRRCADSSGRVARKSGSFQRSFLLVGPSTAFMAGRVVRPSPTRMAVEPIAIKAATRAGCKKSRCCGRRQSGRCQPSRARTHSGSWLATAGSAGGRSLQTTPAAKSSRSPLIRTARRMVVMKEMPLSGCTAADSGVGGGLARVCLAREGKGRLRADPTEGATSAPVQAAVAAELSSLREFTAATGRAAAMLPKHNRGTSARCPAATGLHDRHMTLITRSWGPCRNRLCNFAWALAVT